MRFPDDVVERLVRLSWWDWPPELIKANIELFQEPANVTTMDELARRISASRLSLLSAVTSEDPQQRIRAAR
jgi:hypothetical protein